MAARGRSLYDIIAESIELKPRDGNTPRPPAGVNFCARGKDSITRRIEDRQIGSSNNSNTFAETKPHSVSSGRGKHFIISQETGSINAKESMHVSSPSKVSCAFEPNNTISGETVYSSPPPNGYHISSLQSPSIGTRGPKHASPLSSESSISPFCPKSTSSVKHTNGALSPSNTPCFPISRPSGKPYSNSRATKLKQLSSLTTVEKESSVVPTSGPFVTKKGKSGDRLDVATNYIRLNVAPDKGAYEYEVIFSPFQDSKGFMIKMLKKHKDKLGALNFDGKKLFLPTRLQNNVTIFTSPHPVDGLDVEVKIVFRRLAKLNDLKQMYNVMFKRIMSELKLVDFHRQYFDPTSPHVIPQYKLEIWPGYVTSVDEFENGLMLCLDPLHRVLRTQSVLAHIKDLMVHNKNNWKDMAKASLISQVVMTSYNYKTYRIDDIAFEKTPMSMFEGSDGNSLSFIDYYKRQYGLDIIDINQPLLISRQKRLCNGIEVECINCLVPELSNLTGLSDEMRSDYRVMKEVAMYTRITPNQRLLAMKKFLTNIDNSPAAQQILSEWGFSISPDTLNLNARTLQPENILFGNNRIIKGTSNAEWHPEAHQAISPVDIQNWVLMYTKRDTQVSIDFADTLQRCGPPIGIQVSRPKMVLLESDKVEAYVVGLKKVITPEIEMVVCICPTSRDDRYAAIKRICCAERPVPSQVINSRTLVNKERLRNVVQKIALQMNCKLGGTLWAINIPLKNIMVIGIDTFHGKGCRSVAGFVASFNSTLTRWYSRTAFQKPGQELLDGLRDMFSAALKHYFNVNAHFPDRIFVYRDGVSDGYLQVCRDYEVAQLEGCFKMVDESYNPLLTFIVVQKRINTRIFTHQNDSGFNNPPPGTIVDHSITRKYLYDFFLVSQKVKEGTLTPSHYVVIHDTSGLNPDQLQRMTYKMCHLYYNWPGTIRVPAPCQYAHRIAALIGQAVRTQHADVHADKLFFL